MIDRCGSCGGEFYDLGEIERGTKLDDHEVEWIEKRLHPVPPEEAGAQALVCPGCGGAMQTFRVKRKGDLLIDRCPRCGGTWLDDGEALTLRRLVLEGLQTRAKHYTRTFASGKHVVTTHHVRRVYDDEE